jgi:hypothetical protein
MIPCVWPGDLLQVHTAEIGSIEDGEIVLFSRNSSLWAHRVLRKVGNGLLTAGDALGARDALVSNEELLGRVVTVCREGRQFSPRLTPWMRLVARLVCRSESFLRFYTRAHRLRTRLRGTRPMPMKSVQSFAADHYREQTR